MTLARDERGSALMLVPAAVLVLVMLAAIAVDSAVVLLAERDLSDRTAAVANDIAGFAASDDAFYSGGVVALSGQHASRYTDLAFAPARTPEGYRGWHATATTTGRTVTISAEADVEYIFAKALPGFPDVAHVQARSVVTSRGG